MDIIDTIKPSLLEWSSDRVRQFEEGYEIVWATEHEARGGDELNSTQAGKNYGWRIVTRSQEYAGGEISLARSQAGMVDPKVAWTPEIAFPLGKAIYLQVD